MRWFRNLPLRRRLLAILMVTSGAALLLASVGLLGWDVYRLRAELRRNLAVQAAIVSQNSAAAVLFDDAAAAGETLRTLQATRGVQRAVIYDAAGRAFARFDRAEAQAAQEVPDAPSADGFRFTGDALELVSGIEAGERRIGTLYISANLAGMYTRLAMQAGVIGIVLVLSFLAAFLLSNRLQRIVADPILALAATARAVSRDRDYSRRAGAPTDDDVGVLVAAFNQMLADIQVRDEQLREANRLKDEFLATLSHELRTPLNAVLGWARMLGDERVGPDLRRRAIESIERNARAQQRLIEDLLEISRSVSGKLRLDVAPIDLAAVIDAAIDVVRPAADARGMRLEVAVLRRPAPTTGDAARLQQVVWNLLSNALKFSEPGGLVRVTLDGADGADEIVVSDAGVGIPPAFLPHIFDAFRQADGSLTRAHGGLGLGLAIVRRIVELHGGSVAAESAGPGRGSTFRVRLPRRTAVEAPVAEDRHAAGAAWRPPQRVLEGVRVLLVEDDRDARDLVAMMLGACGARVTAVESAAAARSALRQERPDVIVSDIGMEHQDGYELIRELRRLPPEEGGLVPAVALTAYASPGDRERALAAGFHAHVAKPYEPDVLVGVVADAVVRAESAS